MLPASYQARRFGPAASTIVLATRPGATLGGIWVSAKGTNGTITVYDASASVTGTFLIAPHGSVTTGLKDFLGIGCGRGLTVKVSSCTGTIFFQPSSALA